MAASLSGVFSLQEFSDLGAPLVGGRVYTYTQGTTTLKTAYTDKAGTIPHTYTSDGIGGQYIALNARGELPAPLYLTSGSYDIALKDSTGATIWTRRADPIDDLANSAFTALAAYEADVANASDSSKGSALVGFFQAGSTVARTAKDKLRDVVSVKDFGALGDGAQTLYSTSYSPQTPYTITQQTADGLAINKAITYLRSIGGGSLYFPKGTYRVWGYLEKIDFPCLIYGDGVGVTTVKNCDTSPTNAHAYGIFIVNPASVCDVTFANMTLDGNATVRTQPTGEYGSYPLAWYGSVRGRVENVDSINSPIDCMLTSYDNNLNSSLKVINSRFSNAYRNTVSCVAGWNQQWTNCQIEKGGQVYTGTAPSYCLDIEPNTSSATIKNITFTSCTFGNARGVVAGGVWAGNVKFDSCTFDCTGGSGVQPWAGSFYCGQFTFDNCTFRDTTNYLRFFTCNGTGSAGEYLATQFIAIRNSFFEGVGFQGFGPDMTLENVKFLNCLYPVRITGSGVQSATIRNVTLINVLDSGNYGGGTYASFSLPSDVEGYVDIDGLHIRIEPASLPTSPSFAVPGVDVTGIYLSPNASAKGVKVSNVHVAGYYQKYPSNYGYTLGAGYRDWGLPNTAPSDTAGQTVAPGATPFWRNCTMHGNNP